MSTAPAAPAKVSWLKKVGSVIGKVLKVIAGDAAPIADTAAKVAEVLLPQFAGEIQMADNLVSNIAKQAIVTEAVGAAAATAPTGVAKLESVVTGMSAEMDAWVAANFPGAKQVSAAAKAGLVNAVVAIINEIDAPAVAVPPTPAS